MKPEETIIELEKYRAELSGIMERFVHHHNSCDIRREDDPRYRTIVIELVDLINDLMGKNKYSQIIYQVFIEGTSNYLQSPSYKSVEDIVSVVDSAITWIKRNKDTLNNNKEITESSTEPTKTELKLPDKVTLKWLWEYVPHSFWALLGTLLMGAFVFGVKFADTDLYKSLTKPAAATKNSAMPEGIYKPSPQLPPAPTAVHQETHRERSPAIQGVQGDVIFNSDQGGQKK